MQSRIVGSFTVERELLNQMKTRARSLDLALSQYIRVLARRDLAATKTPGSKSKKSVLAFAE